jgi:hypothetical protein
MLAMQTYSLLKKKSRFLLISRGPFLVFMLTLLVFSSFNPSLSSYLAKTPEFKSV